jgi:hypothetical protein
MVFDVSDEFRRVERAFAAWAERALGGDAPAWETVPAAALDAAADAAALLRCRLGWREGPRRGRLGEARCFIEEALVTARGPRPAEVATLLARLAGTAADGIYAVEPVPPLSPLWAALGIAPRPALLATATFALNPEHPAPPLVREVDLRVGGALPLTGRVMRDGRPAANAALAAGGGRQHARTDAEGRFRLVPWPGGTLTVEHLGDRIEFRPDTGGGDVLLTLPPKE